MYLIVGASSFIGRHLYDYCKRNRIDVLGTYYLHSDRDEWIKFDLCTDDIKEICDQYIETDVLDAVIICGANTSIDDCKENEIASERINVYGTQKILKRIDEMGVKSVFLSSEAVFDGQKGLYTEEDMPNPITIYGCQKWRIEQYMVHHLSNYLILRISRAVSSMYGENDIFHEFYSKMINCEEVVCLKDQSFCLTEVDDIAEAIIKALERDISGLYHLSSANYISRYDLARIYADLVFGGYEKIVEKKYEDIPFLDNRHIYGGLNGDKLTDLLGIHFQEIYQILNKYVDTCRVQHIVSRGQSNDRSME